MHSAPPRWRCAGAGCCSRPADKDVRSVPTWANGRRVTRARAPRSSSSPGGSSAGRLTPSNPRCTRCTRSGTSPTRPAGTSSRSRVRASWVPADSVVLPDGQRRVRVRLGRTRARAGSRPSAPRRRKVVSKPGNHFSLVVHWSGTRNYYHWFHDVLTRLHGVRLHLPPDTTFVVPARLRPFQQDSLRYLGIPNDLLAPYDGEEVWELEMLYFAPRVSNVGSDRGVADQWLRDQILGGADVSPRHGGRRISHQPSERDQTPARQRRRGRAELLAGYGFETVMTENLSLHEQAALFAQAEALVSTHGAGLTNMLFSAPGLKVVDMIEPSMLSVAYIYWAMADELDHEYWYFITDSVPRRGLPERHLGVTREARGDLGRHAARPVGTIGTGANRRQVLSGASCCLSGAGDRGGRLHRLPRRGTPRRPWRPGHRGRRPLDRPPREPRRVRARIDLDDRPLGRSWTSPTLLLDHDVIFHLAANAYIPPSVEDPAFDFRSTSRRPSGSSRCCGAPNGDRDW